MCLEKQLPVVMLLSGGYQMSNAPIIAESIRNIVAKFKLNDESNLGPGVYARLPDDSNVQGINMASYTGIDRNGIEMQSMSMDNESMKQPQELNANGGADFDEPAKH